MKATREGKRFILATLLIAVAAVNTGNNLIYLILSLMLSFMVLSVLLLRINLSGLSLEVSAGRPVFAGEEAPLSLTIRNSRRRLPVYSIHISAPGAERPVYCPVIPPGLTKKEMVIRFQRRGLYRHESFVVSSGFPFILFSMARALKVSGEMVVYPALVDVEGILTLMPVQGEMGQAKTAGSADEMYSLREFRYGDDLRKVHWKASAKASALLVKEYAGLEMRKATILLDNLLPEDYDLFETAVSLAASLSKHFLDSSYLVRILSCKKVVPFGGGDEQLFTILDILSTLREEEKWESPMPGDGEGLVLSVLKSGQSAARQYASPGDMVIYADSL